MRKVINLNQAWKFSKQDVEEANHISFNDTKWNVISIPHTWNAIDGAYGNEFHRGSCWYR